MRTYRSIGALLLLLALLAGCGEFPSEPLPGGTDRDYHIVVRGRITTEDGAPLDFSKASVAFGVNATGCMGDLYTSGLVHPDRNGHYQGIAVSPGLLSPRRCVWAIGGARINDVLYTDTAGGLPATLRRLHGEVPLDTLEINLVLKPQS